MRPKSGQGRLSCNTLDVCMEGFRVGILVGFNLAFLQHTLQEGDNLVRIWGASPLLSFVLGSDIPRVLQGKRSYRSEGPPIYPLQEGLPAAVGQRGSLLLPYMDGAVCKLFQEHIWIVVGGTWRLIASFTSQMHVLKCFAGCLGLAFCYAILWWHAVIAHNLLARLTWEPQELLCGRRKLNNTLLRKASCNAY